MHPTVKPVALIVDAIKDCSRRGGIVLDPFAGSGSTIIAADRAKRVARAIELDPQYVDVIIRRWQVFSGSDAIHSESGRTFNELALEREASLVIAGGRYTPREFRAIRAG
jgi:DNA modification methylase